TALRKLQITLRKSCRTCEKNNPGFLKAVLFDGLNHSRFAACFRKESRHGFLIDEAKITSCEAAFLQERFEFCSQKRRCAGDHDASRFKSRGHDQDGTARVELRCRRNRRRCKRTPAAA